MRATGNTVHAGEERGNSYPYNSSRTPCVSQTSKLVNCAAWIDRVTAGK